ncbi:MAG: hypothetical protein V4754_08390 [Pseudomonadota bacterium]
MDDKERAVMSLYRKARPGEYREQPSHINHVAWSLLVFALGLIFWLSIALVHAENERHALMSRVCQDRVFPAEVDQRCLAFVRTRDHWWQHIAYALTRV